MARIRDGQWTDDALAANGGLDANEASPTPPAQWFGAAIPPPTAPLALAPLRAGTPAPFSASPSVSEPQLAAASLGAATGSYGSNITQAWRITAGTGSTIALIDDGFTPSELANFNTALSKSFGAAGLSEPSGDFHGTTTSGLLASNGAAGIVGTATGATLIGVKVTFGTSPFSDFVSALAYASAQAGVVNNSWGFTGFNPGSLTDPIYAGWNAAIQTAVSTGRAGLGDAIVFAAGNDRASNDDVGVQPITDDPRVIAVAATTASGTVASFSTGGAGLLVSALGDGVVVPAPTTDAYYIASGTSYAAPLVSGVIAMMLSVNPNLGWRDIQEILADTAYAPAPSASSFVTNAGTGWNGGGMHYSNDLGFGIVDALAAVNLARAWSVTHDSANLTTSVVTNAQSLNVPVGGTAASLVTEPSALRVEHVQVSLTDVDLPMADTELVLISPSGTRSVLLDDTGLVAGSDTSGGLDLSGDTITSNAFWGESAQGSWTFEAIDSGGTAAGTITSWTLTVLGDGASSANTPLIYTPEYASLASGDPARTVVSPASSATKTIDLIDLPASSVIHLAGGAGTIDGVPVTVQAGLRNLNADGTTGALAVTASPLGSSIAGGDGATTIDGAGGADTISAGAGATLVRSNNDTLLCFIAGTGASTVVAGSGSLRLSEGTGTDLLDIQDGHAGGSYAITGFAAGTDAIHLIGYAASQAASALATQRGDMHGGTLVTLSDGTRIDISGVAHLARSAFI